MNIKEDDNRFEWNKGGKKTSVLHPFLPKMYIIHQNKQK